jgi:UrcA family protein
MTTQPFPFSRFGTPRATWGAAILTVLFAVVPVCTIADELAAQTTGGRVVDVSLSDLNLSTAEGMRLARDRLHKVAERVCSHHRRGQSSQPAFDVCVDTTVANALRHIDALRQAGMTVRSSVTLGVGVSLADLDLSTLEGAHIAHQRLEAMGRRVCGELARRKDLSYQSNYAACVHDTLAGALAQANVIRAANDTRTAQRNAR